MIACNVVYAVVTIGLTAALADKGLVWVAVAWLAGNVAAGICGGMALLRHRGARGSDARGVSSAPKLWGVLRRF